MSSGLLNYIGFGKQKSTQDVDSERSAVRALPAAWYTSQALYDLEKRAIFSKKWILITHQLRIQEPGDYLRYDCANFQFILYRDSNRVVKGIHNISSNTGSPIVTEQKGKLDEVDLGLQKRIPIHVKVDYKGFIWINLDSRKTPEIAWEKDFDNVDRQERFAPFNLDQDYEFDHEWEMTGAYNWKTCADNYNECYHCATTHPDLKEAAELETYSVTVQDAYILHNVRGRADANGDRGFKVHPTYYFPSSSVNISPNFFFMQRFVPYGPLKTTMRYEVYRNKNAPEEAFQKISQMYRRVMSEDKVLCEGSQKNMNSGIFVNGEMHPRMEKGPIFFQRCVRDAVTEHHQREQTVGTQISPASQFVQPV